MAVIDKIIESLEAEGYNVLPVFGWPPDDVIKRYFLEKKLPVKLLIGISLKIGVKTSLTDLFKTLGVPVINAITLYNASEKQWKISEQGLSIFERTWQVAIPELGGIIQPTVVGTKERYIDTQTGITYYKVKPVEERIEMLIRRVKAWLRLQDKKNSEKHLAIVYYNYPPGKQNIGASYLNVIESLYLILKRLHQEGYNIGIGDINKEELFRKLLHYGRNIGNWAQGEIDRLARSETAILLPMTEYRKWFEALPEEFKRDVINKWGPPEKSNIMTWKDKQGRQFIVIPAIRYGNIILAPQPSRGWLQDITKMYHEPKLPPHHQYIAFYLYLKHSFKTDAIVHFGTHGTHEWLPGKEMGLSGEDPPEILIQDIPNIYPYIVDNVGEGLQAKRRGLAVVIDHMTPPFDRADLNPDLRRLNELINRYKVSVSVGSSGIDLMFNKINSFAQKIGILSDLSITKITNQNDLRKLEEYIKETGETLTPFGLHTFGRKPEDEMIRKTAEAIAQTGGSSKKNEIEKFKKLIEDSATKEMDALMDALSGKYISAGVGNDPIRAPQSLPTGRNFYAFDPSKIPSEEAYSLGKKMAEELIKEYKKKQGNLPKKLTFNLWAVETIRHGGVMEAQIMYLLGVKPIRDPRGRIVDVIPISREELGRPRIDVVMVPSGLYRDIFPNLITLLDKAVTVAKTQDEKDNTVRENFLKLKKLLLSVGVEPALADKLATVRIFTEPPGVYGTGISEVISKSDTWEKDSKIANVFFMRIGHLFGQGFWGKKADDYGVDLLKSNLTGTEMVVHSVSGNLYATVDNDDMFQYLGGLALAVRNIDGREPKVYITNLINPLKAKQESLQKFMGREIRARYFNPKWIKKMLKEGYAGARFISNIIEYLWGWQVTVPNTVGNRKWQEFYEIYVLDRYDLKIKRRIAEAGNLFAYQSMLARMIEVIRKGYWQPSRKILENLVKEYTETVEKTGLTCCDHTCNNPLLAEFIESVLISVPLLSNKTEILKQTLMDITSKPSGDSNSKGEKRSNTFSNYIPEDNLQRVQGYEIEEINKIKGISSAPIPYLFIIGFILFVLIIGLGYRRKR
jgi:cobaltochelatase CobN